MLPKNWQLNGAMAQTSAAHSSLTDYVDTAGNIMVLSDKKLER